MVAYEIIYTKIWYHIGPYEIICSRDLPFLNRLSSQTVRMVQWKYVLITEIKSSPVAVFVLRFINLSLALWAGRTMTTARRTAPDSSCGCGVGPDQPRYQPARLTRTMTSPTTFLICLSNRQLTSPVSCWNRVVSGAEVRILDQCQWLTDTALNVTLRALFAVAQIITQHRFGPSKKDDRGVKSTLSQLQNGDVEYNTWYTYILKWTGSCLCDSIDFRKSVESNFGRSFLSLMASTSTRLPRTEACTDASVFHYLSNVASWMTTHTPGKSTWTLRIPPALATSSNLSNIPLTQLGSLTNSKSRLFCVGDQAGFVCIRGLIPLMISSLLLSHTPDQFCLWRLSLRWRRRRARVRWAELACGALRDGSAWAPLESAPLGSSLPENDNIPIIDR